VGAVAERICGSPDLYETHGRRPSSSINFICAHDGFTLNDLVSYSVKHNEANSNGNSDGADENFSANYGEEGPTNNKKINELRERQIRNFFTILLLSRGVPMLSMADEIKRTQQGNNNSYCQDNEIGWVNWDLAEGRAELLDFVKKLIDFRKSHDVFTQDEYFTGEHNERGLPDVSFHGCKLNSAGFEDPNSRVLAIAFGAKEDGADAYLILNMDLQELEFGIPGAPDQTWRKVIDTGTGFCDQAISSRSIKVPPRTIFVLISQ